MGEQDFRYQVLFTEEELRNIALFMERVELTGKEVPAYVRIQRTLVNATKVSVKPADSPKNLAEMAPKQDETDIKVDKTEE